MSDRYITLLFILVSIALWGKSCRSDRQDKYVDTLTRSHAVMWERLDKIETDFYGGCNQCHDGITGATREEQKEMIHKILRGEL